MFSYRNIRIAPLRIAFPCSSLFSEEGRELTSNLHFPSSLATSQLSVNSQARLWLAATTPEGSHSADCDATHPLKLLWSCSLVPSGDESSGEALFLHSLDHQQRLVHLCCSFFFSPFSDFQFTGQNETNVCLTHFPRSRGKSVACNAAGLSFNCLQEEITSASHYIAN